MTLRSPSLLIALVCAVTLPAPAFGQARQFLVYDGKSYGPDQLDVAAVSPVAVAAPKRLPNGDFAVPRAADGHFYIAGAVNGFPVVFMVDTGARFTTVPARLASNAGIRVGRVAFFETAGGRERGGLSAANVLALGPFTVPDAAVAVLDRLQSPVLGMDALNRFQISHAHGFMTLRPAP